MAFLGRLEYLKHSPKVAMTLFVTIEPSGQRLLDAVIC